MSNAAMMFMLKKLGFEMSNAIEVIDENETEITRHAMSHWYIYKLWKRGETQQTYESIGYYDNTVFHIFQCLAPNKTISPVISAHAADFCYVLQLRRVRLYGWRMVFGR